MVLNEMENKNKIYIQVNQSSFSPNSAVVTRPDSGWVGPGSNPWSLDKLIIKENDIHACIGQWLAHRDVNPMVEVRIPPGARNYIFRNFHFTQLLSTIRGGKSSPTCSVVIHDAALPCRGLIRRGLNIGLDYFFKSGVTFPYIRLR